MENAALARELLGWTAQADAARRTLQSYRFTAIIADAGTGIRSGFVKQRKPVPQLAVTRPTNDHPRPQCLSRRFGGCARARRRAIGAAEEERFRRVKHWAGFPSQAIAYCLRQAGLSLSDVQHIAINQDSRANLLRKLAYLANHRPDFGLIAQRIKNRHARQSILGLLAASFPGERFRGEVHRIEHHLAHLSSAFHVSPFNEAVVVSVDGFGDFSSAAWGAGKGKDISVDGRVYFPHSLGIFYQALTQYLGFQKYGDEYKVMGLAPYGKPVFMDAMRKIVRLKVDGSYSLDLAYFRHHKERISYQWTDGSPEFDDLFSAGTRGIAWTAALARRSARRTASRCRTLSPGYVRGGLLPFDRAAA